jgi:polyisoprenoid-binding protein YceI
MKTIITIISLVAGISLHAAMSFDFTDPKGVNNIRFDLDAPLEAISGTGNGISGKVHFDPANVGATTGTIVLAANTLNVPNGTMKEHLHSEGWLNVAEFPEITFEAKSVEVIDTNGNTTETHITGHLTVKGVTKEVIVPVTFTYLPGALGQRNRGMEGDLLVLRSSFTINRADFGIRPGQNEMTVAPEIQITMAMAGAAPKS